MTPQELAQFIKEQVADAVKDLRPATAEEVVDKFERRFGEFLLHSERSVNKAIADMPVPELPEIKIEQEGRTVKLKVGDVVKSVKVPGIIDRGVYDETRDYEAGDAVSSGGSLFISQKDAPEGAPGDSKDWRLAVKRGRDAK